MTRLFRQAMLALGCLCVLPFGGTVRAELVAPKSTDICYSVCGSTSPDRVVSINRLSGLESDIGPAGVDGIEALTLPPNGTVPFAAAGDTLGTINTDTGAFTAVAGTFGTTINPSAITLDNVVGLAFDSLKDQPAVLYAVHRRPDPENDILFVVDRKTGFYVPNAFGANVDYVEISGADLECQQDIEAIAFHPVDALLFGISNDDGDDDAVVTIAPLTGQCTGISELDDADTLLPIENMGGLTFDRPVVDPNSGFLDSRLFGTTGDTVPADPNNDNKFWSIDMEDGEATAITALSVATDYQALGCPTGPCDALRLNVSHSGLGLTGSTVTFKIYWTNVCIGQDFPDVVITNTLPAGLELVSATSSSATVTTAGNTVTINAGTVVSGQPAGLAKVKARVTATGGSIINQALLTDGYGKQVTADDTVEVRLAKTALTLRLRGQTNTRPGGRMTYVARYRNVIGSNTVTMILPPELGTPVSVYPTAASVAGNVIIWQDLPAPTGMVKVNANVTPGVAVPSILTTVASISDSTAASDTRSQDTVVSNPGAAKGPSIPTLSVAGPSAVTRGLVTQIMVRYTKLNGSARVQVTLPPEFAAVQLTIPKADSETSGVLSWDALPAPSGSVKIKAIVSSTAAAGSRLTVSATLEDESGAILEASDTMAVR